MFLVEASNGISSSESRGFDLLRNPSLILSNFPEMLPAHLQASARSGNLTSLPTGGLQQSEVLKYLSPVKTLFTLDNKLEIRSTIFELISSLRSGCSTPWGLGRPRPASRSSTGCGSRSGIPRRSSRSMSGSPYSDPT